MNNNALISLYDKSNIRLICQSLKKHKINIIATDSTAKYIKNLGYKCSKVSELTKIKEMLDGRVKTLNPKIHASLLFNREDKKHINSFKSLKFPKIDFLIVNLYPFNGLGSSEKKNKREY